MNLSCIKRYVHNSTVQYILCNRSWGLAVCLGISSYAAFVNPQIFAYCIWPVDLCVFKILIFMIVGVIIIIAQIVIIGPVRAHTKSTLGGNQYSLIFHWAKIRTKTYCVQCTAGTSNSWLVCLVWATKDFILPKPYQVAVHWSTAVRRYMGCKW